MRRHALVLSILSGLLAVDLAQAAEVSLVSGLYRSESRKSDGDDAGGRSTVSVGGRYADGLDEWTDWFAKGGIELKSYKKGPSNSTSIELGGGVRLWFDNFTTGIRPYLELAGKYRNSKDAVQDGADDYSEIEESGLFYGADTGVRFALDGAFFMDVQVALFESALYATTETERTRTVNDQKTVTKDESTRTELYLDTAGTIGDILVALGMRF